MSASNYSENRMLDHAVATTPHIRLHIGAPGEDGTGNPAANATRQPVTFAAAASGSKAATGSPVAQWTNVPNAETYSHFSLWDAASAGNCTWVGALSSTAAVQVGDTFQLTALTLTLD